MTPRQIVLITNTTILNFESIVLLKSYVNASQYNIDITSKQSSVNYGKLIISDPWAAFLHSLGSKNIF